MNALAQISRANNSNQWISIYQKVYKWIQSDKLVTEKKNRYCC
jgi:hypothetical protein